MNTKNSIRNELWLFVDSSIIDDCDAVLAECESDGLFEYINDGGDFNIRWDCDMQSATDRPLLRMLETLYERLHASTVERESMPITFHGQSVDRYTIRVMSGSIMLENNPFMEKIDEQFKDKYPHITYKDFYHPIKVGKRPQTVIW